MPFDQIVHLIVQEEHATAARARPLNKGQIKQLRNQHFGLFDWNSH